jgi:hypothetical protein
MDYRTKDGSAEFGFSIEFKLGVGWRVYIILDPFHQNHTDNFDLPYQSIDRDERRYVSWAAKVDSLGDAKTLAGVWAELVQRDQRARKKHELHLELIRLCRCTQKKQRIARGSPLDGGGAGPGYQDRGRAISHANASARSSSGPR